MHQLCRGGGGGEGSAYAGALPDLPLGTSASGCSPASLITSPTMTPVNHDSTLLNLRRGSWKLRL